jgi:hypothetical protein
MAALSRGLSASAIFSACLAVAKCLERRPFVCVTGKVKS